MIQVGRFTVHPVPPRILSSRRVSLAFCENIHSSPLFLSLFLLSVSLLAYLEEPNSVGDSGG